MTDFKKPVIKKPKDLKASLDNYKAMHKEKAEGMGVLGQFMSCQTLTAAKKLLFGVKPKKYVGRRDGLGTKGSK